MRRKEWLITALLLFGGCSTVVAHGWSAARSVAPPPHVTTVTSFFDWRAGSHPAVLRMREGKEHLVVFGALAGVLPSGPAAYVFDKSGRLIDWRVDCGDDGPFQREWHPAGPQIEVDRSFARKWVESR